MITMGKLLHGGIMTNYKCTAACRHCLYACSPTRADDYITEEMAEDICSLLRKGGCRSVHIGGGEPFLNFEGLLILIRALKKYGIALEYIETNAFWAKEDADIFKSLDMLTGAGADTLCISLDPYHVEYVPLERPLRLAAICGSVDFGYFIWQQSYLPVLSGLDRNRTYSRAELEKAVSPRYIWETARSYGLRYGGRAVGIEEEYVSSIPLEEVLSGVPCRELLSTSHFHVDNYGHYIPPGCTGIVLPLDEAVNGIPEGRYFVFEALLTGGVRGLFEYAQGLGFESRKEGYASRCGLCFHIRRWLSENTNSAELVREHYTAALLQ